MLKKKQANVLRGGVCRAAEVQLALETLKHDCLSAILLLQRMGDG